LHRVSAPSDMGSVVSSSSGVLGGNLAVNWTAAFWPWYMASGASIYTTFGEVKNRKLKRSYHSFSASVTRAWMKYNHANTTSRWRHLSFLTSGILLHSEHHRCKNVFTFLTFFILLQLFHFKNVRKMADTYYKTTKKIIKITFFCYAYPKQYKICDNTSCIWL